MLNVFHALNTYARTRIKSRKGYSRDKFETWQHKRIDTWLRSALPKVGYYHQVSSLYDLPIIDKTILMDNFDQFNILNLSSDRAWKYYHKNLSPNGYTIGASTGTSGNRSLYIISDRERFQWLGVMLGKALPNFWMRRETIAVILPQDTALYDSANQSTLLKLRFFNIMDGPDSWKEKIETFKPSYIIAPPKVLRYFSEEGFRLNPRKIFSSAETLDPTDRHIIEDNFKLRLDEIYMASEGLFAVTCQHGSLHLAEDVVHFEFEAIGDDGLVSPIVTEFTRTAQIMARYRMNDLLKISTKLCTCGNPMRIIDEVVGRVDDVFEFFKKQKRIILTPDILRNTILNSSVEIQDFRLRLTKPNYVELVLPRNLDNLVAKTAVNALNAVFIKHDLQIQIRELREDLSITTQRKLRRVENCLKGSHG